MEVWNLNRPHANRRHASGLSPNSATQIMVELFAVKFLDLVIDCYDADGFDID